MFKNLSIRQNNVLWLGIERGLKMLISAIATFYIARYLGVENFGAISFFQGSVLILISISNFGLDNLLVKELALQPLASRSIFKKALAIKTGITIIICLFLFIFNSSFAMSNVEREISLPFFIIFIVSISNIVEYYLLAFSQSHLGVKATVLAGIISNVLKLIAVYFNLGITFIAYCFLVEAILVAIIFSFIFFRHTKKDTEVSTLSFLKLFKTCLPLSIAGISTVIYMRIDQLMLRYMLGLNEVGIYSAGIKIGEFAYFIPVVIAGSYFSKWVSDYHHLNSFESIEKGTRYLMVVAWGIVVTSFLFSNFIIQFLFGEAFAGAAQVLRVHILSLIFVFLGVIVSKVCILLGKEKQLAVAAIVGGVFNILLNYFLIPKFRIIGAASATVVSQFFSSFLFLFLFKDTRYLGFKFGKQLIPFFYFRNGGLSGTK